MGVVPDPTTSEFSLWPFNCKRDRQDSEDPANQIGKPRACCTRARVLNALLDREAGLQLPLAAGDQSSDIAGQRREQCGT